MSTITRRIMSQCTYKCGPVLALHELFSLQLVDAQSLGPVSDASKQPTLLAVAAHFAAADGKGTVRLIDNVVLGG